MERRYHVGRVDGSGKIFREPTRRAAEARLKELKELDPNQEFYLDGPPDEDTHEFDELGQQVAQDLLKAIQEEHEDSDGHCRGPIHREIEALARSKVVRKAAQANSILSVLMGPDRTGRMNEACTMYLGMRIERARQEKEQLEKLAA